MSCDLVALRVGWTAALALTLLLSGCSGKTKSFVPHPTPTATTPNDETSPEAAEAVLRAYYDAIAARRYESAYGLWWNAGGASNQTFDQFRDGFAETAGVEATIEAPGRVEGAAGSRYVDVPVTIRARTRDGESQCFTGSYTLRRSEVDGAGEEQRRWHIYSASMRKCGT